jgi:hypothetical protein
MEMRRLVSRICDPFLTEDSNNDLLIFVAPLRRLGKSKNLLISKIGHAVVLYTLLPIQKTHYCDMH